MSESHKLRLLAAVSALGLSLGAAVEPAVAEDANTAILGTQVKLHQDKVNVAQDKVAVSQDKVSVSQDKVSAAQVKMNSTQQKVHSDQFKYDTAGPH